VPGDQLIHDGGHVGNGRNQQDQGGTRKQKDIRERNRSRVKSIRKPLSPAADENNPTTKNQIGKGKILRTRTQKKKKSLRADKKVQFTEIFCGIKKKRPPSAKKYWLAN